ncbi:hypothetical protein [Lentzea albidocapillata]|uniref:Methyltransferase domain-containing protein n=1 Tax=Lentzea albidocapillata TaxID=40571 RepID=A0A1W2CFT4_9PSEU|nr:hypothetical protein [Lentzea albidocapillata]SMC84021.1 hypothetical protein SAMN05660733_01994 [Lentzea albidocapillata]
MTRYDVVEATSYRLAAAGAELRRVLRPGGVVVLRSGFAAGRERLLAAASVEPGPVVDHLDLLVLRTVGAV